MLTPLKVSVVVCFLLIIYQAKASDFHPSTVSYKSVGEDEIAFFLKNRPRACPLFSRVDSYGEILLRLQRSLKEFKCKEAEDSLRVVVDEIDSLGTKEMGLKEKDVRFFKGSSQVLNSIFDMATSKECKDDLGNKSFLESSADAVLSISRWGVLSAHPSFKILFGGALLPVLLKLLIRSFFIRTIVGNFTLIGFFLISLTVFFMRFGLICMI